MIGYKVRKSRYKIQYLVQVFGVLPRGPGFKNFESP